MSIIQEALKRAQYNYAKMKSLPQTREELGRPHSAPAAAEAIDARAMIKKVFIIVYIIALLALVVGFGMRALFSKMVAMDKERKPEYSPAEVKKVPPDKALAPALFSGQSSDLVLNGIMYTKEKPKAIINGVVVREGDAISGSTVASITENNVLLKYNNSSNQVEVTLKLKE